MLRSVEAGGVKCEAFLSALMKIDREAPEDAWEVSRAFLEQLGDLTEVQRAAIAAGARRREQRARREGTMRVMASILALVCCLLSSPPVLGTGGTGVTGPCKLGVTGVGVMLLSEASSSDASMAMAAKERAIHDWASMVRRFCQVSQPGLLPPLYSLSWDNAFHKEMNCETKDSEWRCEVRAVPAVIDLP